MDIIDFHVHIYKKRKDPVKEILKLMEEYKISKSVVFPSNEVAPDNFWMAEQIKNYKNKFIPFAWINPLLGNKAIEELDVLVKEYDFKGIKLHPLFHSFFPNREYMDPFAKKALEYNIPILIHCGHAPYSTPWQVGEFARQYPNIIVILDHMGLQVGWVDDAIIMAQRYSNIILGTTAMPFHEKIFEAVKKIGSERVIYGSDAPTIHPLPEIDRIKIAGLDENEMINILGENAKRILRIKI